MKLSALNSCLVWYSMYGPWLKVPCWEQQPFGQAGPRSQAVSLPFVGSAGASAWLHPDAPVAVCSFLHSGHTDGKYNWSTRSNFQIFKYHITPSNITSADNFTTGLFETLLTCLWSDSLLANSFSSLSLISWREVASLWALRYLHSTSRHHKIFRAEVICQLDMICARM